MPIIKELSLATALTLSGPAIAEVAAQYSSPAKVGTYAGLLVDAESDLTCVVKNEKPPALRCEFTDDENLSVDFFIPDARHPNRGETIFMVEAPALRYIAVQDVRNNGTSEIAVHEANVSGGTPIGVFTTQGLPDRVIGFNDRTQPIGERRISTVVETLLEDYQLKNPEK